MRRLLLALALLMVVPFAAEAATCTVSTSGTWTAIGTGTAVFSCGTPTTADTIVIPATFTLTIPAGSTVDFSTGAGFITNNGTLIVNGTLKMYNDADGTGTWTVTGDLKTCVTGSGSATCTIGGDSAANVHELDTLSSGRYVSGGWRLTHDGTWDNSAAVGDILEYVDIDGDADNDSPAGALRPFFHISTVTDGSDLIETTYGVGSSVSDYTLAYNEGNASIAAGCYVGDTAGGGAGVTAIDITDSEPDGSELDQTWLATIGPLDRSTTISLPTGTLTNNQPKDFVGQWICLAAAGTDANCYMIWSSTDGGGGRDLVRVWPPIQSNDYTAAAKTCTIGWGEPSRTAAGSLGNPLGEFLIFTPARVMANRPGVSINMTTTGQFNTQFANIGPAAGAAGYGVSIEYGSDSVIAATEFHTWHTGLSGNSAIGIGDDSHVAMKPGSTGTLTLRNVRFTHDFEPRNASSAASDSDITSGPHGVSNVGAGTLIADNFGCFKIGDACVALTSATPNTANIKDIHCGWIDGKSSACVKATTTTHDVTINGLYSANTNSKSRVCDGVGASPTTAGTRCSVAGDCTGVGDTCVDATGATIDISGGATAEVGNFISLSTDSDYPLIYDSTTTGTNGSENVNLRGGFVFDDRTDNANVAAVMTAFLGLNSIRNITMPFATQLATNFVSTYSNNYAMKVRAPGSGSVAGLLIPQGNLGAAGAPTVRIENNVILDIYDATAADFIGFFDTTIPQGAKLYINNNKVDRSRLAGSTTYFLDLNAGGTDFGVAADGELVEMKNNAVSGYRYFMFCSNGTWPASTADMTVTGNAVAAPSNVTLNSNTIASFGCAEAAGASFGDPINRDNTIVNRYQMMNGPVGGYTGPNGVAGYRQTDFLTSIGIESAWVESGGGGGGGDAPCLGSSCGVPNIGSR